MSGHLRKEFRDLNTVGIGRDCLELAMRLKIPGVNLRRSSFQPQKNTGLSLLVGCGKIFWAEREDSFACSKKCNDAAKQRLKRAKGRSEEEKEKQRIYQRERRARIKERKNRRNQIKVERENK